MSAEPIATRKLGRTGVAVSELGLGTAPLGDLFERLEDEEAAAIVGKAWDGGVHYFDTSPWYGCGQSEHRLGRALYRRPRDGYVISTKVGRVLRRPRKPGPIKDQWIGGLGFETPFDYGYDGVMRSFEDSLQRLGISSVDLLLAHDLDLWIHKNPAKLDAYFDQLFLSGWRALAELRDQGAIKGSEYGGVPPSDPGRLVDRAQTREIAARGRADAGVVRPADICVGGSHGGSGDDVLLRACERRDRRRRRRGAARSAG
jgi:D-threo-aldose 1-dehydrogenase